MIRMSSGGDFQSYPLSANSNGAKMGFIFCNNPYSFSTVNIKRPFHIFVSN